MQTDFKLTKIHLPGNTLKIEVSVKIDGLGAEL